MRHDKLPLWCKSKFQLVSALNVSIYIICHNMPSYWLMKFNRQFLFFVLCCNLPTLFRLVSAYVIILFSWSLCLCPYPVIVMATKEDVRCVDCGVVRLWAAKTECPLFDRNIISRIFLCPRLSRRTEGTRTVTRRVRYITGISILPSEKQMNHRPAFGALSHFYSDCCVFKEANRETMMTLEMN